MTIRVLIAEDHADLLEATVSYLQAQGFAATGVSCVAKAEEWSRANDFDVLVLDLGLPDGDGLEWINANSALKSKGVVIMTARGMPEQRLAGLAAGADAYLVKPVPLQELVLHIKNIFGRLHHPESNAGWTLSAKTWELVSPQGKRLILNHSEKRILQVLMASEGEVVEKDQIILCVGGQPDIYDYRRIETLMRRLRARCREALSLDLPVNTIYGKGLVFVQSTLDKDF